MASGKMERKEAYEKSGKPATTEYNQKFIKLIKECNSKNTKHVHVIFLDKNHPPNAFPKVTTEMIDQNKPSGVHLTKIHLIPEIHNPIPGYPLSTSFFFQCYLRCKRREGHETIDNSDPFLTAQIVFMFCRMYKGISFDKKFLDQNSLDCFMRVPLAVQDKRIMLPINLHELILRILEETKGGQRPMNVELMEEFMDLVDLYEKVFSTKVTNEVIESSILDGKHFLQPNIIIALVQITSKGGFKEETKNNTT